MKITSFSFNLEINKDENGYSNSYYVDVNAKGVYISHPYVTLPAEQTIFVVNLIHDFITQSINFNTRIDGFNRDYHLEQYAPTPESIPEISSESAVVQSSDSPVGTTESESTELVDAGDRLEEIETGSDKA